MENASRAYATCLAERFTADECNEKRRQTKIADTKAKRDGLSEESITASIELGRLKANKDPDKSPYEIINASIRNIYEIKDVPESYFLTFKRSCKSSSETNEEWYRTAAIARGLTHTRNRYGLTESTPIIHIGLFKAAAPCRENLTSISSGLPYISRSMLREMDNMGEYMFLNALEAREEFEAMFEVQGSTLSTSY